MKTILVPTDFSPSSLKAVELAALLSLHTGAELVLLNVDESLDAEALLSGTGSSVSRTATANSQATRALIRKLKNDLVKYPAFTTLNVRTDLQPGSLVPVVEEYTLKQNIDLVVMGTLGASGLTEFLIGSNTEKIIRRIGCPVLAVPNGATTKPIRTIVFPTTLRDDQKVAFRRVATFQEMLGPEVTVQVLYVNDPAGLQNEEAIRQRYEELVLDSTLRRSELHIKGAFDAEEGSEILHFAQEQRADLLAMGTHQRRGLSHLLFGSMTENTVNHSDIPVLTIPIH
jgi:nucleotide-binding universal stress UspA family protein